MYKKLPPVADNYLTNRVIKNVRVLSGNVGNAATIDLFKLYGISSSGSVPNTENSRALIKFDLSPLKSLMTASKIDINDPSFNCQLHLFDVYGGQPNPVDFYLNVYPLSMSFDEGLGRDIVLYSDFDTSNWLSASRADGAWYVTGAGLGVASWESGDYIDTLVDNGVSSSLLSTQHFSTGEEDMLVDVTTIVSATLAGLIPDEGFRISFTDAVETDQHTYFVKRFAARHAHDKSKHPRIEARFDDSVIDDSTNLRLDTSSSLVLYNYDTQGLQNITSASVQLSGSNVLQLRLSTPVSGGFYELTFPASQVGIGHNQNLMLTGTYSASVYVPSGIQAVYDHVNLTGSVAFTPIWESLDGTIGYFTGSIATFYPSLRGGVNQATRIYNVSVLNIPPNVVTSDVLTPRVFIFDDTSPMIKLVKTPTEIPGLTIHDVHYQIRDTSTNEKVVPFDTSRNSTRCSADENGMFFNLDASVLTQGHMYKIDVLVVSNGEYRVYDDVSPMFRVV